jgi:uncharacterized protein
MWGPPLALGCISGHNDRVNLDVETSTVSRSASAARGQLVEAVIERFRVWGLDRPDVRAIAVVGSWARGAARPDSDLDLILLTDDPSIYIFDEAWTNGLPATAILFSRSWGAITERRLFVRSPSAEIGPDLEVELGVGLPSWAATEPLDAGTKRVVSDGFRIVHDPYGLLEALLDAVNAE